jgi:hypothetical protein
MSRGGAVALGVGMAAVTLLGVQWTIESSTPFGDQEPSQLCEPACTESKYVVVLYDETRSRECRPKAHRGYSIVCVGKHSEVPQTNRDERLEP